MTIEVKALRITPDQLDLTFFLNGAIDHILVPCEAPPRRVDGLWQHTCFEVFVRPTDGERYREINLAPSGAWAAYDFQRYRQGMTEADLPPPAPTVTIGQDFMLVEAFVYVPSADFTWNVGLSAVIEATDGTKSYWALHHPPGKPDFHHEDCFALRLPPAA
jgi:hypothetical protein